MIELYPAIDVRGGRCVRLHQGDYQQETVYSDDPVAVALGLAAVSSVPYSHVAATDAGSSGTPCREWTKYIHGSAPRPAKRGSSGRCSCNVFHCIWGRFTPGGIQRTTPGITPRPVAASSSSERSNNSCMPMQMPRTGRPYTAYDVPFGEVLPLGEPPFNPEMAEHFWQTFATAAGITLHVKLREGRNTHHIVEATFKGVARCLRDAVRVEGGGVPSTKGTLQG